ncbi:16S rRNA (cytosine(1402)-N(4))-methyltransferase RsmH [Candidatus Roizmanbacteria bacterium]|nr:16S rRNA (cytosine(1402)-N(4))-methyltransferase RsmH [Candidatus Roizmanbacteria bacterium]
MHHPVLINEVIAHLNVKKGGLYIDATVGEGGYTDQILRLGGNVLAVDIDQEQIDRVSENNELRIRNEELKLIQGNFRDIEKISRENGFFPVNGIVFDLGLSMRQLKESGKGLSYKNINEFLDMRLDSDEEKTAADYLNTLSEQNLYDLFAKNSEEINSRAIAVSIVRCRAIRKIKSVGDLVRIIEKTIDEKDFGVLGRIFQALRIEVNREFDNLGKGLEGATKIIKKTGRILVVTFHSLEDRIVKRFVKERNLQFETKKPVTSKGEYKFERSAKLRIITL